MVQFIQFVQVSFLYRAGYQGQEYHSVRPSFLMGLWLGSVGSDQISIDIVIQGFFLSDSQPDRSVQSEQSAQ